VRRVAGQQGRIQSRALKTDEISWRAGRKVDVIGRNTPLNTRRFHVIGPLFFLYPKIADARKQAAPSLVASGKGASFQLMSALDRGANVGVLVDQKFRRGIQVPFFGRNAPTNTLLAKLAKRYDCPVRGSRCIRLPNGRFRLEITNELVLPRDSDGDIDIRGTTELITNVIEGWVREYPEQWLWIHRRWS